MRVIKIIIPLLFIGIVTIIIYLLNMITIYQMLIVITIINAIFVFIAIYFGYKIYKMTRYGNRINVFIIPNGNDVPNISGKSVIIPRLCIDNKIISANSGLLKKNITTTNPFRMSIFRIYMEVNNSIEQLNVYIIRSNESETIEDTIKKSFMAKDKYVLDTIVGPNENINIKFDNNVDIKKLSIDEFYKIGY